MNHLPPFTSRRAFSSCKVNQPILVLKEASVTVISYLTRAISATFLAVMLLVGLCLAPNAQPNSGSSGPDSHTPSGISLPSTANQPPPETAPTQQQSGRPTTYRTTKTPYEFYLSGLTILLGVSAMILVSILFWRHIGDKTEDFVKVFAFVIVAFSALFLIVAGYADSQVAPAYSLLGTIIGYVFGRNGSRQPDKIPEPTTAAAGGNSPSPASPTA